GTGYSGIENPLFFKDNTRMFYGDAKNSIDRLLQLLPSKMAA
ncbi:MULTISPECIES: NAD(P)(+) transhydrogenase (Re/Si-specific) subunit beta, partial [unclassified Rhizobium]